MTLHSALHGASHGSLHRALHGALLECACGCSAWHICMQVRRRGGRLQLRVRGATGACAALAALPLRKALPVAAGHVETSNPTPTPHPNPTPNSNPTPNPHPNPNPNPDQARGGAPARRAAAAASRYVTPSAAAPLPPACLGIALGMQGCVATRTWLESRPQPPTRPLHMERAACKSPAPPHTPGAPLTLTLTLTLTRCTPPSERPPTPPTRPWRGARSRFRWLRQATLPSYHP